MPKAKPTPAELSALKKRLAPTLLAHPAVSGVGVGMHCIRVYLAKDDETVRREVQAAIDQVEPGAPIECVTTGAFRAFASARQRKPTK